MWNKMKLSEKKTNRTFINPSFTYTHTKTHIFWSHCTRAKVANRQVIEIDIIARFDDSDTKLHRDGDI